MKILLSSILIIVSVGLMRAQNAQNHKICKGDTLEFTIGAFDSIILFQPTDLWYQTKNGKILVAPEKSVTINITKQLDQINSGYIIKVEVPELNKPELIITNQNTGNPICFDSDVYITIDPRSINNQTEFEWTSNIELGSPTGRFNQGKLEAVNHFYIKSINKGCVRLDTTTLDLSRNVPSLPLDSQIQCYGTILKLKLTNETDYDFIKWESQNNSLSCSFCESPQMTTLLSDTLTVTTSYLGCEYKKEFSLPVTERLQYTFEDETCPGEPIEVKLTNMESFDTIRWENLHTQDCTDGLNCAMQTFYPDQDTVIFITTILNDISCTNNVSIPISVKPGPQRAEFVVLYPEKCSDKAYRIKFDNANDYDKWSWVDPAGITCIDCEIFDVTNTQDSIFFLQLESQGCERKDSLSIKIEKKPPIDFSNGVCGNESAFIDLGQKSLYQQITWSPRPTNCSQNLCNYWSGVIQNDTTTYIYRRTKNLCEYNDTISIQTIDTDLAINVNNPPNEVLYVGNTVKLSLDYDTSIPSQNFIWYQNDREICSGVDTCEIFLGTANNAIKVESSYIEACETSLEATVQINVSNPEISASRIPTIFTPDESNNTLFKPLFDIPYTYRKFDIYNRWGKQLISVDEGGWDGRVNGKDAPADIYRYSISIVTSEDKIYTFNGEVMLLR